jgi:hypothetical protein
MVAQQAPLFLNAVRHDQSLFLMWIDNFLKTSEVQIIIAPICHGMPS